MTDDRADGGLGGQIDVTYQHDAAHGWIPASWTCLRMDSNGNESSLISCKVEEYEINPSIPADAFKLHFPPGTRVLDESNHELVAVDDNALIPIAEFLNRHTPYRPWLLAQMSSLFLLLHHSFGYGGDPRHLPDTHDDRVVLGYSM